MFWARTRRCRTRMWTMPACGAGQAGSPGGAGYLPDRDGELCRCDPARFGVLTRKSGTVTNTNRQVQMGRPAVPPPGEAREDWAITVELAQRLGLDWHYDSPADVFAEMKREHEIARQHHLGPAVGRECGDLSVCCRRRIRGRRSCLAMASRAREGRARFTPASVIPPDEAPDADYPMILTTGRQLGALAHRIDDPAVEGSGRGRAGGELFDCIPKRFGKLGIDPGGMVQVVHPPRVDQR